MALSEFELIQRYFSAGNIQRQDVVVGIGDDCAILSVPEGQKLAVTMDTLVEGVHFFPDMDPEALGYKALAVNLSDLAAIGAEPAWASLALTLPDSNPQWLERFSHGFLSLAEKYAVQLVGGDTTQGPLAVTVQVHGFLPAGGGLRRAGARPGDLIYVTGSLGDAGLAVANLQCGIPCTSDIRKQLEWPEPRVEAGMALREIASAAIDVSDGLLADLGHILDTSGAGGVIYLEQIPLSERVRAELTHDDWTLPLTSGDDYELCFTVPPARQHEVPLISAQLNLPITQIGQIESTPGLRCLRQDATLWEPGAVGYEHFSTDD